ncbi:MAG: hypothetical protein STSR0009_10260 [Methanoregula sp.]
MRIVHLTQNFLIKPGKVYASRAGSIDGGAGDDCHTQEHTQGTTRQDCSANLYNNHRIGDIS